MPSGGNTVSPHVHTNEINVKLFYPFKMNEDDDLWARRTLSDNNGYSRVVSHRTYVSMTGADPQVHVYLYDRYLSESSEFNMADLQLAANYVKEARSQDALAPAWHMSYQKYNNTLWKNMPGLTRLFAREVRRNLLNFFLMFLKIFKQMTEAWKSRTPISMEGTCAGATIGEDTTLLVTHRPGIDAEARVHVAAPGKYC